MSGVRTRRIVAYVHVFDVAKSASFYQKLGFEPQNTWTAPGAPQTTWMWLQSGDASLMIARASGPIDAEAQAVFFYVYCDDVPAAREALVAQGVACGPITTPFYCPKGEFRVTDPDGYGVMIAHT